MGQSYGCFVAYVVPRKRLHRAIATQFSTRRKKAASDRKPIDAGCGCRGFCPTQRYPPGLPRNRSESGQSLHSEQAMPFITLDLRDYAGGGRSGSR